MCDVYENIACMKFAVYFKPLLPSIPKVTYGATSKSVYLKTPIRKTAAKRLARRSYGAMMTGFATSKVHCNLMVKALSRVIKSEIDAISIANSPFKKNVANLKEFNWDVYSADLQTHLPTLFNLIHHLIRNRRLPRGNQLMAMIASMLLKNHSHRSCYLQSVISLMFYAKGCQKQVCVWIVYF